tara:strand:+ start:1270 stop:1536 length:267 start_codon:yes stop_codon:yes gene_type:complete
MPKRKTANVGLVNEITAQLSFAKDSNTIVFTPLCGLGPIDIITLNLTTGEYSAYDVKSKNYRKKGSFIHRGSTKEQKKLKVKIIYATI